MIVNPQAIQRAAAWLTICATLTASFEGLATHAYHDRLARGLPTVCYGETLNVKMSDTYTPEQCLQMLAMRLPQYNAGIDKCIHVPMSDTRRAAAVSLAYNVGVGAVCKSSFVRRLNAHDPNACDSLLAFNRASGKVIKGLVRRRQAEYKLCTE